MPKSSRTGCSSIAESMCMSDCTHSIVSRCVRSPLQPFHFCLFPSLCAFISRWPPPLHPALVWVFLSYTSCVPSALLARGGAPSCRTPICLLPPAEIVVFVPFCTSNSRKTWYVEGCLQASAGLQKLKLSWNEKRHETGNETPHKLVRWTFVTCSATFFSPPSPWLTVPPVFPRGPCVPPRPHIRHTHKYTHMVLITQTNESGEWGIRWKENTVGHSCQ